MTSAAAFDCLPIAAACYWQAGSVLPIFVSMLRGESGLGEDHLWAAVGNCIGCTYQLLDDCLNVYAPKGALNKSTGVDLQQGRLTLPLLTALKALEAAGQGISIDRFLKARLPATEMALAERTVVDEAVRACLEEEVGRQIRAIEQSARWRLYLAKP